MPDITGLPYLTDGIASYLQGQGIAATCLLGWREKQQQINEGDGTANRVIVQPGDDAGRAGELGDPRQVGYGPRTVYPPVKTADENVDDVVPRELADWAERATVYIWACDPAAPEDDRRQYIAARALLQSVRQALQFTGRNSVEVGAMTWVKSEDTERQYGRELALEIVYHAPLFDTADELVHPTSVEVTGSFQTTQ